MNDNLKNDINIQADKTIDRANVYNSVICSIGHGAYFAILSVSNDRIPDVHLRFSLICMTLSVTVYVLWEVVKVTVNAYAVRMFVQMRSADPSRIESIFKRHMEQINKIQDRLGFYWIYVLIFAVITALMSAATLVYELMRGIVPI